LRADELYSRSGYESEDGNFIHKRKWMRWRTFNRLMDRASRVSREADIAALAGLARLGFFSWHDAYASVLDDSATGTTDAATGGDPTLATVGTVHGPQDAGRKG